MNIFYHSGGLGDIISALPVIRELGGGVFRIGDEGPILANKMEGRFYKAIKPLLKSQGYIEEVEYRSDKTGVTHDFSTFRDTPRGSNLISWQGLHLGVSNVSTQKWLEVEPSTVAKNATIIGRVLRYSNPIFPWREILLNHNIKVFVGFPEEHAEFEREFGPIHYVETNNLLELAELICGADMFIGSQSSIFWVARGLDKRIIQETWPGDPIAMVPGPNFKSILTAQDL